MLIIEKQNKYSPFLFFIYFLKEYDGCLSFTTDTWMSPNQWAYVAITIHLEHNGEPLSMLLDIVEVVKSHSGENLATAFAKIMDNYEISENILINSNIYIYIY